VIVSRQSDGSSPCSTLPATSQVTKSPVVHPLSIQQVTKCFSRNSFALKTIHFDGGCVPRAGSAPRPSSPRLPIPYFLFPIPFVFTFFRTPLHFFALIKNSTLFFSYYSTLFRKNTRGGVVPPRFPARIKMNQARANSISKSESFERRQPRSTPTKASLYQRFASHPCSFLVNYIDPILYLAGPRAYIPLSTRRPRSTV
jgi:hypothetical protein